MLRQERFLQHYGHLRVQVTEMAQLHGLGKPMRVELTLREYAGYAGENQASRPRFGLEIDGKWMKINGNG